MLEIFTITDENPNDVHGGSGCLCSPTDVPGCQGPYVVFHATTTDWPYSPHAVLSEKCARACVAALDNREQPAPSIDTTAVEEEDGPPV